MNKFSYSLLSALILTALLQSYINALQEGDLPNLFPDPQSNTNPAPKSSPPPVPKSTKVQKAKEVLKKDWNKSATTSPEDMKTLNQAIDREGGEAARRITKRQEARNLQDSAKKYGKVQDKVIDGARIPLGLIANIPDPHVKAATTVASIVLIAVKYTGKAISGIMMSVGRYQERAQEIESANEQLIEAIQQSIRQIAKLKSAMDIITKKPVETPTESKEEESKLKKMGKAIVETAKNVVQKVRSAKDTVVDKTDFITNRKAGQIEVMKKNQAALKAEQEIYTDLIRVLQIKLLQDDIKQIDKLLSVQNTLSSIKSDIKFTEKVHADLESSKKTSKKQMLDISQKLNRLYKDLSYYTNYKEKTPEQLQADKEALITAIEVLKPLTKMGRAQSLQARGIDTDKVFSKEGVIELYEELYSLKKALCSLPTHTEETDTFCQIKRPLS